MKTQKKISAFWIITCLCGLLWGQSGKAVNHFFTTELVVKFSIKAFEEKNFRMIDSQESAELANLNTSFQEVIDYLKPYGNIVFVKVFPGVEWGDTLTTNKIGQLVKIHDLSQFYKVIFPEPIKLWETIYELRSLPGIEHADPVPMLASDITPDDLHGEGNQWNLTKVNATSAWDVTTGDDAIKIAIIDQGVDDNHPDLANKLTGGESGYSGDHGTKVAGVAGAETNNGVGIASLGWEVKLVPFDYGNGTDVVFDINRARTVDNVDVINCSFRTLAPDPNDPQNYYVNYDYLSVGQAVNNAIQVGIVVVASAGNPPGQWQGLNPSEFPPYPIYPATYPGVIAVSATDQNDNFPSGYNYGSHVDVSGPSISILTTDLNDSYGSFNGTSFGAPLVSALAGLTLSINPDLDESDVETIIENSAVDLGSQGWDDHFGSGRIDAFEALKNKQK